MENISYCWKKKKMKCNFNKIIAGFFTFFVVNEIAI